MKDLHSHLLFGIDDGCKDIGESITLLKKAQEQGITDLVVTPHYIEDTKYLEILKKEIKNITYNVIDEFVKIIIKIENFEDIEFYINTEHLEKIKQNSFF